MQMIQWIKKNPGAALFSGNIVLFGVWILLQDPFGLSNLLFASRNRVVRLDFSRVTAIEVRSSERQSVVRMERGARLPGEEKSDKPAVYQWNMTRQVAGKTDSLAADRDRIKDLFAALERARRAYSMPLSPENERTAEINADSSGAPRCTVLILTQEGGKSAKLCIGKSSLRGNDSYVRADEENDIYIVEENLKTAVGAGDPDFFRNRRLLPDMERDMITAISTSGPRPVQLVHAAQKWQMTSPVPAAVNASQMSLLLGDLVDLKAAAFLTEVPKDLDRKKAFELTLQFKSNMVDAQIYKLSVLGQKDFSAYVVRDPSGQLAEVTSMYLADLLDPEEKLIEKEPR